MQARHVRKKWAGPPVRLFCDGERSLRASLSTGCHWMALFGDAPAAYSPWQNGLVERKGAVWKSAYAKAQLETFLVTKQETQELIDQVNNAVNSMSRVAAWCSLMQQRVNCACVGDLIEVNKVLSMARDHCRSYIWVEPIPVNSVHLVY